MFCWCASALLATQMVCDGEIPCNALVLGQMAAMNPQARAPSQPRRTCSTTEPPIPCPASHEAQTTAPARGAAEGRHTVRRHLTQHRLLQPPAETGHVREGRGGQRIRFPRRGPRGLRALLPAPPGHSDPDRRHWGMATGVQRVGRGGVGGGGTGTAGRGRPFGGGVASGGDGDRWLLKAAEVWEGWGGAPQQRDGGGGRGK